MEGARSELPHLSAIRGEGLVFELGEVNVLCLVNVYKIKGLGIRSSPPFLTDDLPDSAVEEGNDIVPVVRHEDGLCPSEFLRRSASHTPMDVALIPPRFPVKKHGG